MRKKKVNTDASKPVKIAGNFASDTDQTMYLIHYNNIFKYTDENGNILTEKDIPSDKKDDYVYDEELSQANYFVFREKLKTALRQKFPSLIENPETEIKNAAVLTENKLFVIALRDNEWSLAVQIMALPNGNKGLQTQMLPSFTLGVRDVLLTLVDTIYVRTDTFNVEAITKDNLLSLGSEVITKTEKETESAYAFEADDDDNAVI